MGNLVFTPHELQTIEVDVKNKIFRVNGENFGDDCTGFTIGCNSRKTDNFFDITMRIATDINYASYDESGKKTSDRTIKRYGQL